MEHDEFGFVDINLAINNINKYLGYNLTKKDIILLVNEDKKERFFIDGDKIKAQYGQSFEVKQNVLFNYEEIKGNLYALVSMEHKKDIEKDGFFSSNRINYYFYENYNLLIKDKNLKNKVLMVIDPKKIDKDTLKSFFKTSNGIFQTKKKNLF